MKEQRWWEAPRLWLGNDKGAQTVVPNGSGHCQHTHDTHAIPEQYLPSCCLHTCLQWKNYSIRVCSSMPLLIE